MTPADNMRSIQVNFRRGRRPASYTGGGGAALTSCLDTT
jgi:hypothetical protein